MIHALKMQIVGRDIEVSMDLDPANRCDAGILDCMIAEKPCEPEVCNVLARVLKEGDCAVDGGANVGFLTVLMSKLVGETGHVYAFEPGGNNLPKLSTNLRLNKSDNVVVIDKPLAAWVGEIVTLHEHDHPGYNSLWPDLSKKVMAKRSVPTTTIEKELLGRPIPVLIKLDVEGSELAALRGTGTILKWRPPIVVTELNEAAFDRARVTIEDLREFMSRRGYDAFMLFEDGNVPCLIPRGSKIVTTKMNANVMFTTIEKVQSLWPEVFG